MKPTRFDARIQRITNKILALQTTWAELHHIGKDVEAAEIAEQLDTLTALRKGLEQRQAEERQQA